ncbi:hypothetical protein H0E87_027765 [Populus deltoides]|uniref:Uncharacterized protein n=1 Tax=Populus deltoides TaxID=3696 RepID=A0A8T2WP90_POPDE|nr:hypothetical protein H0E87_027765 [Populus deltoides]
MRSSNPLENSRKGGTFDLWDSSRFFFGKEELKMEDWEDVQVRHLLSKEQPKNKWDDEDVDEDDVKESWEDEDEPARYD